MKTKDIKKKMIEESSLIVPDLKADLKIALNQYYTPVSKPVKNKKRFISSLATTAFALALVLFVILPTFNQDNTIPTIEDTYVAIDINPSIELIVDYKETVKSYRSLNNEAQILLFDQDLTSLTVEEASKKIIELALEVGYIDESITNNAVLLTSINKNDTIENKILNEIKTSLSDYFLNNQLNDKVELIVSNDESLKIEAKRLGVSVGKLALINKAIEVDSTLTVEAAKRMSVKVLNEKIKDYKQDDIDDFRTVLEENFNHLVSETYNLSKEQLESKINKANEIINKLVEIKDLNHQQGETKFIELKDSLINLASLFEYTYRVNIDGKFNKGLIINLINEVEELKTGVEEQLVDLDRDYDNKKSNFKKEEKSKYENSGKGGNGRPDGH